MQRADPLRASQEGAYVVNWFTSKLNLDGRGRGENQLCHVRDSSLSTVEQLEDRLCLGTLTAPPIGDLSGIVDQNEPTIASDTSLLLVSSEADLLQPPMDDQNREEAPVLPYDLASIPVVDNSDGIQLADTSPPIQTNVSVEVQLSSGIDSALPANPIGEVGEAHPNPPSQPDSGLTNADEGQASSSQPVPASAAAIPGLVAVFSVCVGWVAG